MNKQESLTFLQSCIEKVKEATAQDIQFYKEVYNRDCISIEKTFEFEFVFPVKTQMEYNFLGVNSINQQNSDNLPYAA